MDKRPEVGEYYSKKGQSIVGNFFKVTIFITSVVNQRIYYKEISSDIRKYEDKIWLSEFQDCLSDGWYHDKAYNSPLWKVLND